MTINLADWQRLGVRFVLARTERGLTQDEARRAAGIGKRTLEEFEKGDHGLAHPSPTMRKLASFYRWTPDSIDNFLSGESEVEMMPTRVQAEARLMGGVELDRLAASLVARMDPRDGARLVAKLRTEWPLPPDPR